MKKFKKIIVTLLVFGVGSFISFAKADTFDYSTALLDKIRPDVIKSGLVRTKPEGLKRKEAVAMLCKMRIAGLQHMINSPVSGSIEATINWYRQQCGILTKEYEYNQLYRSTTPTELRHNANAIRTVYIHLLKEASEGLELPDSGEEEKTTFVESKKRYMTTRENRRVYQGKCGRK